MSNNETTGSGPDSAPDVKNERMNRMKNNEPTKSGRADALADVLDEITNRLEEWQDLTHKTLGLALVLVGSGMVGILFSGLDSLLQVVGIIGYAMGLYGILLVTKDE